MTEAYKRGFLHKCAEHGVDGRHLLEKLAGVSADGRTFTLDKGKTISHVVADWNKANPANKITAGQVIRANNGLKATKYRAGKAYNMPAAGKPAVAKPVSKAPAVKPVQSSPKPASSAGTGYSGILTPEFYAALGGQESNNVDSVVNPKENAHGRYQIRPGYLADANQYAKTNYTLSDMHDPEKAKKVMSSYFARYVPGYTKRTGKPATAEVLARIHNGGPRGAERVATLGYWNGVSNRLETAASK